MATTDKLALLRAMAAKSSKTLSMQGKALVEKTKNDEGCVNMQCVVLSRRDPQTGASGKKGPTRFNLWVLSPSTLGKQRVQVPIEQEAGATTEVGENQHLHLSSFQVTKPKHLVFGALVQVCGLSYVRINDALYYSAKKIKWMESDKFDLLERLPGTFYHLPKPSEISSTSAVLRFRGSPPVIVEEEGACAVYTLPDESSHYVHEKEDGSREVAFKADFSVMQWGGDLPTPQRVLISTRLYENHLDGIGIMDPDTWMYVAPTVLKSLHGYVPGYIHKESTNELDINTISPSDEFDFGLVFKGLWNASTWNHRAFLETAAIEVGATFVKEALGESNASSVGTKNVLNQPGSSIWNLSEHNGDLRTFYAKEGTRFWVVANHSLDDEDLKELRGLTTAQREECLHKKPGCPMKIHYNGRKTWVIFATLSDHVGDKRKLSI